MANHEKYMQRCLQLAKSGLGYTSPNPLVGSVIVHNDKIIGEGYHHAAGKPHAEVNAVASVWDKELLKDSTLYVNLEPCSHYGKTPPCTDLILKTRIPRVVIGCSDPNPLVSGKGINILKNAGVEVITGICEQQSRFINRRFITFQEKKRPYIILKWAQTTDGFIDLKRIAGTSPQVNWITNEVCRSLVHKWRAEEDAVLVGANTIIADDPLLNLRYFYGRQPLRIIIDRDNSVSGNYRIFSTKEPVTVFCSNPRYDNLNARYVKINFDHNPLQQILDYLWGIQITSVMVEGGTFTLNQFISNKLFDEIRVFQGNKIFSEGVKAPDMPQLDYQIFSYGNSVLNWGYSYF